MQLPLIFIMFCVVIYALLAKRLSSSIFTSPMIFLTVGYVLSLAGVTPDESFEAILHLVAELALIVLLFVDASHTDLEALRKRHLWPQRMLLIGMPLSIILTTIAAAFLLPGWSFFAVALVASILAPTDAALGQAVVSNEEVPIEERRTLVVESGLNDGLALPIILFFSCTLATIQGEHESNFLIFTSQQLILGPLVGGLIGFICAKALLKADKLMLTGEHFEGIAAIAIAVLSYLCSDFVGGNGFIAAFCSGLVFGYVVKDRVKHVGEFVESEGQILIWVSFLLIGLVLLPEALHHLNAPIAILIALSLFLIRPLAIYLSLIGTDAPKLTRLFFGWFGPRGLATALFALLIVGEINDTYADPVLVIAINAVWMSVLLHGISAAPGARWYSRKRAAALTTSS